MIRGLIASILLAGLSLGCGLGRDGRADELPALLEMEQSDWPARDETPATPGQLTLAEPSSPEGETLLQPVRPTKDRRFSASVNLADEEEDDPLKGIREGDVVVGRPGRLQRGEQGRWWFVFEGEQAPPSMEILPNPYLEEMERIAAGQAEDSVIFTITAEVTRYRDRALLLIRKALREQESFHVERGRRPDGSSSEEMTGQ